MNRKKNNDIWIGSEEIQITIKMLIKTYMILCLMFVLIFCITTGIFFFFKDNFWVAFGKVIAPIVYLAMKMQVWIGGIPDIHGFLGGKDYNYIYGFFCNYKTCWWGKYAVELIPEGYWDFFKNLILHEYLKAVWFSLPFSVSAFLMARKKMIKKAEEVKNEKKIRGRLVIDLKNDGDKMIPEKYRKKIFFRLSESPEFGIGYEDTFRHILILGASGTGKTTLIHQFLSTLRKKKKKAIVYGYKGDFLTKWYIPGDIIFSPYDIRNIGWTITNDIRTIPEIRSFAETVIKETEYDRFWSDAGRMVLTAVLAINLMKGEKRNIDLLRNLSLPYPEMVKFLDENISNPVVPPARQVLGGEKQGASVLSMLSQFTSYLSFVNDGEFSFRRWVRNDNDKRWIFIENGPKQENLAGIYTAVINIIATEILSRQDGTGDDIYVVIDEWGTLRKLNSILRLITLGRAKKCVMVLANQDLARVQKEYTVEMNSIFNSLGTCITFKIEDQFTQDYISRTFGNIEVNKLKITKQMGPEDVRDGVSFTKDVQEKKIILGSELGYQETFHFTCRLPNGTVIKGAKIPAVFFSPKKDIPVFIEKRNFTEISDSDVEKEREIDLL